MTQSYTYPAVYIEEQPATGPIAGVGTSTPALLGPTLAGPVGEPTKITNWTQFSTLFGGYSAAPRLYLPHAVRGFFQNGGTTAYVVRVGTAMGALWDLADRATPTPGVALRVRARQQGLPGNSVTVAVQDATPSLVTGVTVQKQQTALLAGPTTTQVHLANAADAAKFRPGDQVQVVGAATRYAVARILGDTITLGTALAAAVTGADVLRLADLAVGQDRVRVSSTTGIEPGSVLRIAQAGGNSEDVVVAGMAGGFVVLAAPLTKAYPLAQTDAAPTVTSAEFTLVVKNPGSPTETFAQMSMDPRHSHYYARAVSSALVTVGPPAVPNVQRPPTNTPAVIGDTGPTTAGANDNPAAVGLTHYDAALTALEKIDDVSLVCAPGRVDAGVQAALVGHCERMADRVAILDGDPSAGPPFLPTGALLTQRAAASSARGFAALYYPWITINDPLSRTGDDLVDVPPSGHLVGLIARSDAQRGVHKAPANELVTGAVDLTTLLGNADQGEINVAGINAMRVFPGQRPIVWGARTTAPPEDVAWRYLNVRRLFVFVEQSIQRSLRWAVFEPNDVALWKKLDRTITEFLTRVWRSGALFGTTAEQAFYVKVDKELNPPEVRALGQVVVEVGIAPVRPAEFIVVRIAMWDGGTSADEN